VLVKLTQSSGNSPVIQRRQAAMEEMNISQVDVLMGHVTSTVTGCQDLVKTDAGSTGDKKDACTSMRHSHATKLTQPE
jgi:hypothetical protein